MLSCSRRDAPADLDHRGRQVVRRDDAGVHRVLQVVGAVGDPVGPADDLPLDGGRGGPGPGVVADPVQRLEAQVQPGEHDVRAPRAVVVAVGEEGVEGVLAGVPAGPVAAVVAERDRLGQGDVDPDRPGDRGGDLGHLERVGQPGPLVVARVDHDLGLAGQPAERGGVHDPVPVALEAGALVVRLLGLGAVARRRRPGWRPGAGARPPTARAAPGRRPGRVRRGRRSRRGPAPGSRCRARPWSRPRRRPAGETRSATRDAQLGADQVQLPAGGVVQPALRAARPSPAGRPAGRGAGRARSAGRARRDRAGPAGSPGRPDCRSSPAGGAARRPPGSP